MKYYVRVNGRERAVELRESDSGLSIEVDGEALALEVHPIDASGQVLALCDARSYAVAIEGGMHRMGITIQGHFYAVELEDERERAARAAAPRAGIRGGLVQSVMPGIVARLLVEPGQRVQRGDPLLILEAMKMQNEIGAPVSGTVATVHVEVGRTVSAGEKLVSIRPVEE